jgi:hypothetical protein
MRKPRDINAEIRALREKEAGLKATHRAQLVELLERTGADRVEPEVLAGALLAAVEADGGDRATREAWRQRGEAFFRPARTRRGGDAEPPAPATGGAGASGAGAPTG